MSLVGKFLENSSKMGMYKLNCTRQSGDRAWILNELGKKQQLGTDRIANVSFKNAVDRQWAYYQLSRMWYAYVEIFCTTHTTSFPSHEKHNRDANDRKNAHRQQLSTQLLLMTIRRVFRCTKSRTGKHTTGKNAHRQQICI